MSAATPPPRRQAPIEVYAGTERRKVLISGTPKKTANLTVAVGFKLPAICVDVHVHRICNWLKLAKTSKPVETEMALRKILPVRHWKTWNSHLMSFGQTRCDSVSPKCDCCPIARFCHSPKKKA